jgi:hypothetical protein
LPDVFAFKILLPCRTGEQRFIIDDVENNKAGELRALCSVGSIGSSSSSQAKQASTFLTLIWSPPSRLRGVPLLDLKDFWARYRSRPPYKRDLVAHSKGLSEDKQHNMYDAVNSVVMPYTAASHSSLAELLNFGPCHTFVSHFWGAELDLTLEALTQHSKPYDFKEHDVRVWICSIANNQRRITEELDPLKNQS